MRLFQLTLNSNDWNRYLIEGGHQNSLPALSCDTCGSTWKTTGESYPTVELDGALVAALGGRRVLGIDEFTSFRDQLRPLVPAGAPLMPGASFGIFAGTAKGRFFDFAWNESWTMFLQTDAFFRLRDRGVRFPKVGVPKLQFSGKGQFPDLIEPEAVPLIDLSRQGRTQPVAAACLRCGRQPGAFEEFLLDASVIIPQDVDLCRARNNSAVYVVTEHFADAVHSLELTGFVLKELRIVDPGS